MTTKQKQCLLCYLGYYTGPVDGIWGEQSTAAAKAFLQAFPSEDALETALLAAIAQPVTDWWEDIEFFEKGEFACKCGSCGGYPAELSQALVEAADRVRKHFSSPAIVSSGLRCKAHNAKVGGVSNSRHLTGKAIDFRIQGRTAKEVLAYVQTLPEIRYSYAIDAQYLHMDVI